MRGHPIIRAWKKSEINIMSTSMCGLNLEVIALNDAAYEIDSADISTA